MSTHNGSHPGAGERRVRVLIVENHQVVSEAMSALLSEQPNLYVVGTAATGAEAVARLQAFSPDVVLIDYHLAEGTGIAVAEALRALQPKIKIIFVSRSDGAAVKLQALEAGASGFIHKSKAADDIVAAVRTVAGGSMLFTTEELASLFALRRQLAQLEGLTDREVDVLRLIRLGHGSRDIAQKLGIAYATVRSHVRALERKLGAHDKVALLARARELGVAD
ncbi:MAG TPA: response regulator transcription factor [Candidatus Dormibacteraeota bacterium]|nr:response regulator transcription factor [Candidatus Dormibacteraeota bacterium]